MKIKQEQWVMSDTDRSPISLNHTTILYYIGKMDDDYIKSENHQPKFLHLVCDDEPILRDWCIDNDGYMMYVAEINEITGIARGLYDVPYVLDGCKKIIASTNISTRLPSIPESFIKYYIEKQGEVGDAELVHDVYEVSLLGGVLIVDESEKSGFKGVRIADRSPKLTKDNSIIIEIPLEVPELPATDRMYSKEEMETAFFEQSCDCTFEEFLKTL